jgi:hypothetical protein
VVGLDKAYVVSTTVVTSTDSTSGTILIELGNNIENSTIEIVPSTP